MAYKMDFLSRQLLNEGWLACSLADPSLTSSNTAPTSGLPVCEKVVALVSAAVTHVICAVGTAPTLLTAALVDASDSAGTQLSLSTDKSGSTGVGDFGGAASDKAIVVPSFNIVAGKEYFIRMLFTATTATPALIRGTSQRGINAPRISLGSGAPYRHMQGPAAGQTTLATFDPTTYVTGGAAYLMGLAA